MGVPTLAVSLSAVVASKPIYERVPASWSDTERRAHILGG
jgi:hypothetical protein